MLILVDFYFQYTDKISRDYSVFKISICIILALYKTTNKILHTPKISRSLVVGMVMGEEDKEEEEEEEIAVMVGEEVDVIVVMAEKTARYMCMYKCSCQ